MDVVQYNNNKVNLCMGPFKCYVTQMGVGGGGVKFSGFLAKSVTKV